ncbi:TPA: hypothetical protein N0F65_001371 [Lagenidium giganteum]|uniref:Uncharacterized protein n=1 Tax=Lagenidium giganteum TaxID=4803 RepID=A0AAV2YV71_9STRA|nr:TPA: hypothetical protein N0F65_001371 [Lagenidium giganteum]
MHHEISQPNLTTSTSRRSPSRRSSSIVMLRGTDDLVDLADDDYTGTGGTTGPRDNALSMEASSIALTMTPTTQFLEQPVLLDVKKTKASGGVGAAPGDIEEDRIINLMFLTPNIPLTFVAAAVGFVIGAVCNKWPINDSLGAWIGLFGRLYQNVMECLALPLIFTTSYFVIGCFFMAYTSGQSDLLTGGRVMLLILVSTLSSFGTAHLPGAALGYISTIWITVFPVQLPTSYIYLVWMEWIITRIRRVLNVIMVAFIARIIADQLDETAEDEDDRTFSGQGMYRSDPYTGAQHRQSSVRQL